MTNWPFILPVIRWADVSRPIPSVPFQPSRVRRLYDHLLVYGLTGEFRIVIEGQSFDLTADHLFLIRPRVSHCFFSPPDASSMGVHFDWLPQHDSARFSVFRQADELTPADDSLWRVPRSIPHWDLDKTPFLDLTGRPRVRQLMEEIIEVYARRDERSQLQAGAILATAILQISYEAELLRHAKVHHATLGADAVRRVQRARELLESPRMMQSSVADVAKQVGWSTTHLRRMFHLILDNAPHRVQISARMRQAKELLRTSELTIAEIALRCGFDDPAYFSRAFKKECELSPSAFVKQNREG